MTSLFHKIFNKNSERLNHQRTVQINGPNIQYKTLHPPSSFQDSSNNNSLALQYATNEVITSQYTWYTFLPLNAIEQFSRLMNVYFLCLGILQMLPQTTQSLGVPTIYFSLGFIIIVSAIRAIFEDVMRHKQDKERNKYEYDVLTPNDTKSAEKSAIWAPAPSGKLKVGQIIRVKQNEMIPADILILGSSNPKGHCFVDKCNLNGEAKLEVYSAIRQTKYLTPIFETVQTDVVGSESAKKLSTHQRLQQFFLKSPQDDLINVKITLDYEPPNKKFDSFHGKMTLVYPSHNDHGDSDDAIIPNIRENDANTVEMSSITKNDIIIGCSAKDLLMRETILRNTAYIYGIVVYTGNDTKIQRSNNDGSAKKVKVSYITRLVNKLLLLLFALEIVLCMIATAIGANWFEQNGLFWYFFPSNPNNIKKSELAENGIIIFFTWLLNMAYFVAIAMPVTAELSNFTTSFFINQDIDLYFIPLKKQANANSFTVHDDLANITMLCADKTGTLTANAQVFRYVNLANKQTFGSTLTDISRAIEKRRLQLQKVTENGENIVTDAKRELWSDLIAPYRPKPKPNIKTRYDLDCCWRWPRFLRESCWSKRENIPAYEESMSRLYDEMKAQENKNNHKNGENGDKISNDKSNEEDIIPPPQKLTHNQHDISTTVSTNIESANPLLSPKQPHTPQNPFNHEFSSLLSMLYQDLEYYNRFTNSNENKNETKFLTNPNQALLHKFMLHMALSNTAKPYIDHKEENEEKSSEYSQNNDNIEQSPHQTPDKDLTIQNIPQVGKYPFKDIKYQVDNAEELALLTFSAHCGYIKLPEKDEHQKTLFERDMGVNTYIAITPIDPATEKPIVNKKTQKLLVFEQQFVLLAVLGFTSKRARVTLVYQDVARGNILIMIKGQDSTVVPLLYFNENNFTNSANFDTNSKNSDSTPHNTQNYTPTEEDVMVACKDACDNGLRVLVVGHGEQPLSWWEDKWAGKYSRLLNNLDNFTNEEIVAQEQTLFEEIEKSALCEYLCIVGLEDKLQELVPETIADLLKAGIKVCVISGDKLATIKQIALSCNLIDIDMLPEIKPTDSVHDVIQSLNSSRLIEITGEWNKLYQNISELKTLFNLIDFDQDGLIPVGDLVTLMQHHHEMEDHEIYNIVISMFENELTALKAENSKFLIHSDEYGSKLLEIPEAGNHPSHSNINTPSNTIEQTYQRRLSTSIVSINRESIELHCSPRDYQIDEATFITIIQSFEKSPYECILHDVFEGIERYNTISNIESYPISLCVTYDAFQILFPELLSESSKTTLKVTENTNSESIMKEIIHTKKEWSPPTEEQLEELRAAFFFLVSVSKSLIFARAQPSMKKKMVTELKKRFSTATIASIGDGVNDVGMLTESHVSFGILGKEGSQASSASDYAIGSFRMLHTLIFKHGFSAYYRMSLLVTFIFYKTAFVVFFDYLHGISSAFSGSLFIEDAWKTTSDLLFTSLGILFLAIFDKPLPFDVLENNVAIYRDQQYSFNIYSFVLCLWRGILHSCIVFFVTRYVFSESDIIVLYNRNNPFLDSVPSIVNFDVWFFQNTVFLISVVTINLDIFFYFTSINMITIVGILISIGGAFFFAWLFSSSLFHTALPNMAGVASTQYQSPLFWLTLIIAVSIPLILDLTWQWFTSEFFPSLSQIIRERLHLQRQEKQRPSFILNKTPQLSTYTSAPSQTHHTQPILPPIQEYRTTELQVDIHPKPPVNIGQLYLDVHHHNHPECFKGDDNVQQITSEATMKNISVFTSSTSSLSPSLHLSEQLHNQFSPSQQIQQHQSQQSTQQLSDQTQQMPLPKDPSQRNPTLLQDSEEYVWLRVKPNTVITRSGRSYYNDYSLDNHRRLSDMSKGYLSSPLSPVLYRTPGKGGLSQTNQQKYTARQGFVRALLRLHNLTSSSPSFSATATGQRTDPTSVGTVHHPGNDVKEHDHDPDPLS